MRRRARIPPLLLAVPASLLLASACETLAPPSGPGQRGDERFELPDTGPPAFAVGTGLRVAIDEAHHNYHTADGRYRNFAELLRRDGFRVDGFAATLAPDALGAVDVLVISNAISAQNAEDWTLPNHSALSESEIEALEAWVAGGGSLLLIADHMPMPGATAELAAAFGIFFHDGFAYDPDGNGRMTFRLDGGGLEDHSVTRLEGGAVLPFVTTFTGQAFRLSERVDAIPLLRVVDGSYLLLPTKAWEFSDATPRIPADGMLQGALVRHGRGRVAVFGEAAAFTAQVQGEDRRPMGMNHPDAPHNARFVLNVMRWLAAVGEGSGAPARAD